MNSSTPPVREPTLAIALSGGGKRASFFSLGALLAVVEAGYNESTVAIASVSGGSITNAAIAATYDFSQVTREEFRELVDDLAEKLQRKRHRVRVWWLLVVTVVFTLIAELSPINALWNRIDLIGHSNGPEWPVVLVLVIAFSLIVLGGRTLFQECVIARLFSVPGRAGDANLKDLAERKVAHIFCLTDLESGLPLLFRNDRCLRLFTDEETGQQCCEISQQSDMSLARVVTGSAAFPGAFAPSFLKLHDDSGKGVRNWTVVSAGGVYNNLATDWLLQDAGLSEVIWPDHWPIESGVSRDSADHVFVVDASAPRRFKRLPLYGPNVMTIWEEFKVLFRVVGVINSSNVAHRQMHLDLADDTTKGQSAVHRLAVASPATSAAQRHGESGFATIKTRAGHVLADLLGVDQQEEWGPARSRVRVDEDRAGEGEAAGSPVRADPRLILHGGGLAYAPRPVRPAAPVKIP